MNRVTSRMPSTPIGTLIQKIQCQEKYCVMNPPTGGPSIGPTSAGMVIQAMACTSSLFGTLRSKTSRPTGIIIAPPMPWMERATTKPASDSSARS